MAERFEMDFVSRSSKKVINKITKLQASPPKSSDRQQGVHPNTLRDFFKF